MRACVRACVRVMGYHCSFHRHIRLFEIFSVEKYLGPMVTMVGKMTVKMLHFIVLLVIILFSFGVLRQSIRFPNEEPDWYLLRHVFYQPYFMLYGEVYAPEIEPEVCGQEEGLEDCHFWITVFAMAAYLLVANILMLNMMIAVFNNIFASINAVSHEVWMFQRYRLVMEYELRPVCPPPFIIISHLYMLLVLLVNRCRRDSASYDRGLKLFLDEEALENVHDFEEECLEAYFRQKESEALLRTDRLVQQTWERQEQTYQRLEDVLQREVAQLDATRLVDYRLKRLEETLGAVERLATTTHAMLRQHTGISNMMSDVPPGRPRYTSTGSAAADTDRGAGAGAGPASPHDHTSHNAMVQELVSIALSHGPRRRRSKAEFSARASRAGSMSSQGSQGSVPAAAVSGLAAGLTEPDGGGATLPWPPPEIHVLPPGSPTLDLPLGEYRSITDGLESRCLVELRPGSPPAARAGSPTAQQVLTAAEDGDYQSKP
ncbi:Transient receptor potential cation channel trpm [Amphibalanus amphitrite]|uniref:Transient receptor potential cation channel trpm n=1 Tax=Amphibalanus amphitrite TaxID=1232801 RepID=A0A6A4W8C1_AMPAM|nr:Transient receptor potential cation channel trpm [Amphibalanus amphitrite]